MKKRYLRAFTFLLISAMLASLLSVFAFAANPVEIVIELPDTAVNSGQTFVASVRFANPTALNSTVVAGMQIEIGYDGTKLATDNDSIAVNSKLNEGVNASIALANVVQNDKKVIFVAVKNTFTETSGYTSDLSDIFTISFKALTNISNVFNSITFTSKTAILGDGKAQAVPSVVNVVKAASASGTLSSITGGGLTYVESPQFNGVALGASAVRDIGDNTTLAQLKAKFATSGTQEIKVKKTSGSYINNTDKVATGMTIELWDGGVLAESALAIVKGDTNGDGSTNVFDAIESLKYIVDTSHPLSNAMKYAGKLSGTGNINVFDAIEILKYVINGSWM